MITLQQQPGDIAFSRNEMVFRFLCTDDQGNLYGPKGVRSQIDFLNSNVYLTAGDTIVVSWTEPDGEDNSVTFTAADTPSGENQLPTDQSIIPSTNYEYWAVIASRIQRHHLIGPFFKVYAVNNGAQPADLVIEALEISDDWSVSWDASGITDPNVSTTDFSSISADNTPGNYRLIFDLFFESEYGSGDYDRVLQAYGVPGADGIVRIAVDEVIDRAMVANMAELPIPAFSDNTVRLADTLRRYYVRYRESFDAQADPAWTYSDVKTAMCGGISQGLWASYDFFGNLSETNSLLSWTPDKKRVSKDQPEWIGWYNYTGADAEIVLELNQTNAAGNLAAEYKLTSNNVNVPAGEVLLIPGGYTQLAINDADQVQRYSVRVVDADSDYAGGSPTYLSQSRTYYVDDRYFLEKRYIMYLNGFCLPETLRCTGDIGHELDIDRQRSEKILQENYTAASPQTVQWKDEYLNRFTYRSGYLSKQAVESLTELLVYNQAWEVYEEGYIPLDIQDDRFRLGETRDTLRSVTFRAVPKLRPRNYSNILIPMEAGQDAWLTNAEEYWQTVFGLPWETP